MNMCFQKYVIKQKMGTVVSSVKTHMWVTLGEDDRVRFA